MRQGRRGDRRSPDQELFAARQVYVRSGPTSQYVALSPSLQITVAAGMAAVVLWLGVASYTAVAKHLETVELSRELTRLEGIAKALRITVEESQDKRPSDRGPAASTDLMTELAEVRLGRERAMMLADAAAGEAAALRAEVALVNQRIRELEVALVSSKLDEVPRTDLVGNLADRAAGLAIAGGPLEPVTCPGPWADARR